MFDRRLANRTTRPNTAEVDDKFAQRLAACYACILFFAFLTESTVQSLELPLFRDGGQPVNGQSFGY